MINALGSPQSVLVLGGTSDIAQAILTELPVDRMQRVVLAGRHRSELAYCASTLADRLQPRAPSGLEISTAEFDAAATDTHAALITDLFSSDIDLVIMAFGVLGDQADFEANPRRAVAAAQVNYVGTVSVGLEVAKELRRQGHGQLVVITSVAGERARRSNFVYGSTKSGQDTFVQGLGDAMHGSGAEVLVVRPGFVHSKMTAGLDPAPLSVTPEQVAKDTIKGLRRGSHTVYSPATLRFVMAGLKSVPRSVFRRLPI